MKREDTCLKVLGSTIHTVSYSVSVTYVMFTFSSVQIKQEQKYIAYYNWYVMF
jgi:hypothetical protein